MKKYLTVLCATLLLMANAQAATHPTCKKFFKEMDAQIARLPDEKRKSALDSWTPTKARMVQQSLESQARACQNGLNSVRTTLK